MVNCNQNFRKSSKVYILGQVKVSCCYELPFGHKHYLSIKSKNEAPFSGSVLLCQFIYLNCVPCLPMVQWPGGLGCWCSDELASTLRALLRWIDLNLNVAWHALIWLYGIDFFSFTSAYYLRWGHLNCGAVTCWLQRCARWFESLNRSFFLYIYIFFLSRFLFYLFFIYVFFSFFLSPLILHSFNYFIIASSNI